MKFQHSQKILVGIVCTICLVCVFMSGSYHLEQSVQTDESLVEGNISRNIYSQEKVFEVEPRAGYARQLWYKIIHRPVTSDQRIVYNRVGKCGSRSVLLLMKALSVTNNYNFIPSDLGNQLEISEEQQKLLANNLHLTKPPFVYNRHLHYVEFEKFTGWKPIYINMIRDPIERFVSGYYFSRFGDGRNDARTWSFKGSDQQKFQTIDECVLTHRWECSINRTFYIIPFFCGQEKECRIPSRWALEKAKKNVLEKYLVVGLTEEFEQFLQVLERLLPDIFNGIVELWKESNSKRNEKVKSTQTLNKKPPSQRVREILRRQLQLEYEFYDFVRIHFSLVKRALGMPS